MRVQALGLIFVSSLPLAAGGFGLPSIRLIETGVAVANLLLAFALLVVGVLAYQRLKNRRLGLIALAFGLFSLRWILELATPLTASEWAWTRAVSGIFELMALLVLLTILFLE